MQRLLLLATLLASVSLACPVKKGFIADGALPIPSGFVPKCDGEFSTAKAGFSATLGQGQKLSWFEMYTVPAGSLNLDGLVQQLSKHGYKSVMKTDYQGVLGRRLRDSSGRFLDLSARKSSAATYTLSLILTKF